MFRRGAGATLPTHFGHTGNRMNQTRLSKGFDENCKTPSISALLIQCMLNNRMGKRYYGLDIAKGISVLGNGFVPFVYGYGCKMEIVYSV